MMLTRRGLLLSTMVLLAPSARLRAIVARSRSTEPTSLDEFVELSQRLLGRSKLDRELAQIYLNALLADADNAIHLATLVQMNGNPTPEQAALVADHHRVVVHGVYTIDGKPRLATHTGALVWSALGMPAPGTCAGAIRRVVTAAARHRLTMPWSADIVIVGSGVAGSLVATRLARAGLKVVILEAGPRVQRAAALAQYRDRADQDPGVPVSGHAVRAASGERRSPITTICRTAPTNSRSPYLRLVGGTTWHWLGTTLRFVPDDFRLRSRFGVGVDWPISYDDLEPWYCEAERELGVAGDPNADLKRRAASRIRCRRSP